MTEKKIYTQIDRNMARHIVRWTDRFIDRQMEKQIDRQTERWTEITAKLILKNDHKTSDDGTTILNIITLSITTFNIMTLSIKSFYMTLSKTVPSHYGECHFAECSIFVLLC